MYTEKDKHEDFCFFVKNYSDFAEKYGNKYLAIKGKKILGVFDSIQELLSTLSKHYKIGTYIIQECSKDKIAYHTTIMRLQI